MELSRMALGSDPAGSLAVLLSLSQTLSKGLKSISETKMFLIFA